MVRSRPRPESGDRRITGDPYLRESFLSPGCQGAPTTSPTARRTDSAIAYRARRRDRDCPRQWRRVPFGGCDRAKTVAGLLISLLANLLLTRRPLGRDCSRAQSQNRTHLQGASRATSLPELWVGLTDLPLTDAASPRARVPDSWRLAKREGLQPRASVRRRARCSGELAAARGFGSSPRLAAAHAMPERSQLRRSEEKDNRSEQRHRSGDNALSIHAPEIFES